VKTEIYTQTKLSHFLFFCPSARNSPESWRYCQEEC